MVNYRGVKLCAARCSQQPKPYRPMTSKNVRMRPKGFFLITWNKVPLRNTREAKKG